MPHFYIRMQARPCAALSLALALAGLGWAVHNTRAEDMLSILAWIPTV